MQTLEGEVAQLKEKNQRVAAKLSKVSDERDEIDQELRVSGTSFDCESIAHY